jgi:hypothetical protein
MKYYNKKYSFIKFPIEEGFNLEFIEVNETQISTLKSTFLVILSAFSRVILKLLNTKILVDEKWSSKKKFGSKTYILDALTYVDHYHSIVIFKKFTIKLDHFFYIFARKLFLVGDKNEYPTCLEKNFQLRAIYEMSNFRLKIYTQGKI